MARVQTRDASDCRTTSSSPYATVQKKHESLSAICRLEAYMRRNTRAKQKCKQTRKC